MAKTIEVVVVWDQENVQARVLRTNSIDEAMKFMLEEAGREEWGDVKTMDDVETVFRFVVCDVEKIR